MTHSLKQTISKLSVKNLNKLENIIINTEEDKIKFPEKRKIWIKLIQKEKRKKIGISNNKKASKKGIILIKKGK